MKITIAGVVLLLAGSANAARYDGAFQKIETPTYLTHAVLKDGREPVCTMSLIGKAEMLPDFAQGAPSEFQSKLEIDLPYCGDDERSLIKELSQSSVLEHQVAAAPAAAAPVLAGGALICGVGALVGGLFESTDRLSRVEDDNTIPYAISGSGTTYLWLKKTKRAVNVAKIAAGGFLGYMCSELGEFATGLGLDYIGEAISEPYAAKVGDSFLHGDQIKEDHLRHHPGD